MDESLYLNGPAIWPDREFARRLERSLHLTAGQVLTHVCAALALAICALIAGVSWFAVWLGEMGPVEPALLTVVALTLCVGFGMAYIRSLKLRRRYLELAKNPEAYELGAGTVVSILKTHSEGGWNTDTVRIIRWSLGADTPVRRARIRISLHDHELWPGQPVWAGVKKGVPSEIPLLLGRKQVGA